MYFMKTKTVSTSKLAIAWVLP
ncbi:MAG: hypothetical protein RLZZ28_2748, partial [Bacteroidota bacterium]